jgi:hypothetical protein
MIRHDDQFNLSLEVVLKAVTEQMTKANTDGSHYLSWDRSAIML